VGSLVHTAAFLAIDTCQTQETLAIEKGISEKDGFHVIQEFSRVECLL
jgi:hypothetical protein